MQLKNVQTRYSPNFAFTADDAAAVELEKYSEYKQREINLLVNLIKQDDKTAVTVWDVGAGCGVHTLALSRHAAIVVAFEHDKDKAHALGMNTTGKLGPNIKVITERIGNGKENTFKLDGYLMKMPEPSIVRISDGSLDVLNGAKALMMIIKPVMFIGVHGLESIAAHYKILQKLDYKLWWYGCPVYNEDNYKKVLDKDADTSYNFSILAMHKSVTGGNHLDLPEVLGSNDTYARFSTT